ncbi:DUF1641 domain-containing protein [Halolamina rubra]|uniref:DUF1641 domain-containing protein n=1 Tax=Halolamina rubra TaxID=1380430 RepID=UPI000679BC96|nr:DUF1641 domain-containing protein [Halolamina rubra]
MASDEHTADTTMSLEDDAELARVVEQNDAELAELLRLLLTAEDLAGDLTPELREAVHESREPLGELRLAFEREETLTLLTKVGNEADTLVELLDVLAVSKDLTDDLVPELLVAVRENRETIERLRGSLEDEQTLILLERLGDNAETLTELLDLLDATHDLATELTPELQEVAQDNRDLIREFRMAVAGFSDVHGEQDVDMYQLGRNAGNMVTTMETLGDPVVTDAVDATVEGFTQEDPKPVGFFGLVGALFDADVRRALGRLVAALRALGQADLGED